MGKFLRIFFAATALYAGVTYFGEDKIQELLKQRNGVHRINPEYENRVQESLKKIDGTQQGDNTQISGIVDTAKELSGNEEVTVASMAALRRIGTEEAKNQLYSLVLSNDHREIRDNLPSYAARELAEMDPFAAVNAVAEARRSLSGRYAEEHRVMKDLREVLYDIGNEDALDVLMAQGNPHDIAYFVIRNKDKNVFYRQKDALIEMFEGRIMRGVYSGGINCNIDANAVYRFAYAINILDRTYAERYLLGMAESTGCIPFPVEDSLRNNSFR